MYKSPGCGKQRVLSPHQLPHLHSDVAEFVAQEAAEAHEGRGVAHDLLRLGHHLIPVGRGLGGLTPPGAHRDGAEGRGPPQATRGSQRPETAGQAHQQWRKAHSFESGSVWGFEVPGGIAQGNESGAEEEVTRRNRRLWAHRGAWVPEAVTRSELDRQVSVAPSR